MIDSSEKKTAAGRPKSPESLVVFSTRIPEHLRDGMAERLKAEGVSQARFISDCIEAYLSGRLRIEPSAEDLPSYYARPSKD